MKIFLDDVRNTPDGFDTRTYTAQETNKLIASGRVTFISLDHDLGSDAAGTGYDVAKFIEEMAYVGSIPRLHWAIHSANPVGISNMRKALQNADSYWNRHSDR